MCPYASSQICKHSSTFCGEDLCRTQHRRKHSSRSRLATTGEKVRDEKKKKKKKKESSKKGKERLVLIAIVESLPHCKLFKECVNGKKDDDGVVYL